MTRQKTQPAKKSAVAKKAPVKKSTTQRTSASKNTRSRSVARSDEYVSGLRFFTVSIGIFVVAVSVVVVMGLLSSDYIMGKGSEARVARINDVYAGLNLDKSYVMSEKNVFGEKRVYSWDAGRTHSSSVTFLRGDSVTNTVADMDARIKAAGFTFIDEPYAGSKDIQYHYRSADGEYIRLTVSSKQYLDAFTNARLMGKDPVAATESLDMNAGPSRVVVKVNLDDNNE